MPICARCAQWSELGVERKAQETIKKQLLEAPPMLFRPTLTPCLNVLCPAWINWLDSKEGKEFCAANIELTRSLAPQAERSLDSTDDYLSGW